MSDICERLVRFNQHKECVSTDLEVEAAAEITRLREENARLREALRYYAEENYNGYNGSGAFARAAILGKVKAEAACPELDEAP